jgi:UDP-3-O-[3-hydroxymyristoyl] glucosamine N-acyltransferase
VSIEIPARSLAELAARHGGEVRRGPEETVHRIVALGEGAGPGDLALLTHPRYVDAATGAAARGAHLLVASELAAREDARFRALASWIHPHAVWAVAELLAGASPVLAPPSFGEGTVVGAGAVVLPGVRVGARVTIAPGAVIGAAGFGFVVGPDRRVRDVPQLGGVVIEDDVHVGALATIAAGTIGPTILRRGVKLDAQVHVGHNCEIGEGTRIAAQCGLAGSVVIGRSVLIGGQAGIADHLVIGDGARIAAKSGVIADVPPGAVVAGYPAVDRPRWLRGLAELYRFADRQRRLRAEQAVS